MVGASYQFAGLDHVALFGIDFGSLFSAVKNFLGPLGQIWDKIGEAWTHLQTIGQRATQLKDSIVEEIDGWKNFKSDIRLKQRVVQIESAIEKTRALIEGIPAAWRAILDLIKQAKDQLNVQNPVEEAQAITTDIEEGGIKTLLTRFPALARACERVLAFLGIVVTALEAISNVVDDFQTIVDEMKRLRLEIEKLDTIFLSQSNKRRRLKLADGSTIRIRVGHLHS